MNRRLVVLLLAFLLAACAKSKAELDPHALSAEPIGGAECAACGMVVREQPAPRGQLVFHDGTRAFACSAADLIQVLAAPSPHGKPTRVFIEVLDPDVPPAQVKSTTPTRWANAFEAHYVVGVARPGVMGPPVLAYASKNEADRAAAAFGGRAVGWDELERQLLAEEDGRGRESLPEARPPNSRGR
jgi:copper chaperone NosL